MSSAWGAVVIDHGSFASHPDSAGRLSPFALIHGEPLVACAAWALGEAGVVMFDDTLDWDTITEAVEEAADDAGEPGVFVAHDPMCPMTPPEFISDCIALARESGCIVVGARVVTDTVKQLDGEVVGVTVPREGLRALAAPVVVPASLMHRLSMVPGPDLVAFVSGLPDDLVPLLVEAPAQARRVGDHDDLIVLEALTSALA